VVHFPDESGHFQIAVMAYQPSLGCDHMLVAERPAHRQKRENAVGRGRSVTAKVFAIVAGLVDVELGRREEEAAIGIIGELGIEVLATFDKHPCELECRIGNGYTSSAQGFEHVARHGEIHVARVGRHPPVPTHAPCSIRRIFAPPAVLFRELLCPQVLDHWLDLPFPARALCLTERAYSQCCCIVR